MAPLKGGGADSLQFYNRTFWDEKQGGRSGRIDSSVLRHAEQLCIRTVGLALQRVEGKLKKESMPHQGAVCAILNRPKDVYLLL
jgi:hypothetical protein